jgi:hypothetical protein
MIREFFRKMFDDNYYLDIPAPIMGALIFGLLYGAVWGIHAIGLVFRG